MAAVGEAIAAAIAFIFEMLVLSLIGLYKLCGALLSKKGRIEVREKWASGREARVTIIAAVLIGLPVSLIGFGVGLPLAYSVIKNALSKKEDPAASLAGIAEITVPHSKDPNKQLKIYVDRSRLNELKDTKDIPDLLRKFREISTTSVEDKKKPDDPADTAARPSKNAGDRTNNPRGTP